MKTIQKSRIRIPAFLSFGFLMFSGLLQGQIRITNLDEDTKLLEREQWWVNIGAGVALRECYYGLPVGSSFSYRYERQIFSGRLFYSKGGDTFVPFFGAHGGGMDCPERELKEVKEFGLVYGYIEKGRWSLASIAAGPGLIAHRYERLYGEFDGNTYQERLEVQNITKFGLSLEAQGFITFSPRLGIGIYAFGNINSTASLVGFLLSLQVGKLW